MKLTQKQLLDLLSGIGLAGVELVEDEAQSEFDNDTALAAIDGNRRSVLEPQIKQALEGELKTSTEGRVLGGIRAMLARNTGVPHSKLKEFPEDKMEDLIKFAINHKIGTLEGDKEAHAKYIEELMETHNQTLNSTKQEYEGKLQQANERYVERDVIDYIETQLKSAPLPEKLDKRIAAQDFKKHLAEKYHLSYKEAERQVALMDKANPANPALNESKNAHIDILAEAKTFFEPRALWVTDMRDKNPAEAMQNRGTAPARQSQAPTGRTTPQQQREQRLAAYDSAAPGV